MATAAALARAGGEVELLLDAPGGGEEPPEVLAAHGEAHGPGLRLWWPRSTWVPGASLERRARLARLLGGVDAVLVRDVRDAVLVARLRGALPVARRPRLVMEWHSIPSALGEPDRGEAGAASAADAHVAVSRGLARALAARFPGLDAAVVPNGARLDAAAAGRRIAALPGARAVVQAGLLRRPEDALPLADLARGLPPPLQVRLAGDPEHEGAAALHGALGDGGRPSFTGFLPPVRIAPLYDGALCALALYAPTVNARDFASPLKVLEAHAAGVPLVATDLPSVRELADDGVDALLVPPGDPCALVATVARLHADRALAARLAVAGLARAAARTWDHRARALRVVLAPAPLSPETPRAGISP